MRFTLHYRGPLRSQGNPAHKHELRRAFHLQLSQLFQQQPLKRVLEDHPFDNEGSIVVGATPYPVVRKAPFTFLPLVTSKWHTMASLEITMLRPEEPGRIIVGGGDIDNRLKTLFDALSVPAQSNAMPTDEPGEGEHPFFCLLEDDSLINEVSVRTDRLLEVERDRSIVELLVTVRTLITVTTFANIHLS